jgi:hypothetical protein
MFHVHVNLLLLKHKEFRESIQVIIWEPSNVAWQSPIQQFGNYLFRYGIIYVSGSGELEPPVVSICSLCEVFAKLF